MATETRMGWCSTCRKEVPFTTETKLRTTEMDGRNYTYPARVAFCKNCGDAVAYKPYQNHNTKEFQRVVHATKAREERCKLITLVAVLVAIIINVALVIFTSPFGIITQAGATSLATICEFFIYTGLVVHIQDS